MFDYTIAVYEFRAEPQLRKIRVKRRADLLTRNLHWPDVVERVAETSAQRIIRQVRLKDGADSFDDHLVVREAALPIPPELCSVAGGRVEESVGQLFAYQELKSDTKLIVVGAGLIHPHSQAVAAHGFLQAMGQERCQLQLSWSRCKHGRPRGVRRFDLREIPHFRHFAHL